MAGPGITALLGLDSTQFARGLLKASGLLNNFSATAARSQRGMFDDFARSFGPAIVKSIAAVGIGSQVIGAVKRGMEAETMNISFDVLVGDTTKAQAMLKDLRRMAALTPYEFPGLADATRTLMGFGVAVDDALPTVAMLSELGQGSAETLSRIALVYGQISAAGRLMGQDLLQLINAGFNPLQVISQKTGETMLQLKKRMENGAVSFEEVKDAFEQVTGAGGRFYKMNERQSKTTAGLFSTLRDAYGELQRMFGGPINDSIRPLVAQSIELVTSLQKSATAAGQEIGAMILEASRMFKGISENADFSKGMLGGLWDMIKPIATLLGLEIELALTRAANAFVNFLRDFAGEFGPEIGNGILQTLNGIYSVIDGLMASLRDMFYSMANKMPFYMQPHKDAARAIAESVEIARQNQKETFLANTQDPLKILSNFANGPRSPLDEDGLRSEIASAKKIFVAGSESERDRLRAARRAEIQFMEGANVALPLMGNLPSPDELFAWQQQQGAVGGAASSVEGRPVGALASAINLIMGRSANELIYDEAKKQTAVQQQMADRLAGIEKNTARPQSPAKPVVIDTTARFARP